MDDLLVKAVLAGVGVALAAGPLGCFVVWRRMAYFGDTLAHGALLGVAVGVLLDIWPMAGILLICLSMALALVLLQKQKRLAGDTLLGILSQGGLALGLVSMAFLETYRVNLMGYLFGDILSVSSTDLIWIYGGALASLALLAAVWRPLLSATVHEELALVEGVPVERMRLLFMVLIALVVAAALKVVGILLITSLLIIPAATARRFARTPEAMAVVAALVGVLAVVLGVAGSFQADTPSGPSIVVAALLLFGLSFFKR